MYQPVCSKSIEGVSGKGEPVRDHILGEVEAVCDRVGILNDGCLVATGTPAELRSALGLGGLSSVEVSPVPTDHRLDAIDGVRYA